MSRESNQVDASDLYVILINEIISSKLGVFRGMKIDQTSVQIRERISSDGKLADSWIPHQQYPGYLDGLRISFAVSPSAAMEQSHCGPIELDFCKNPSYNITYYPNMVGHMSIQELRKDFIMYRQIVDFECYTLAREFICHILQPECQNDVMVSPCRTFCEEFWRSCQNLLPKNVYDKINCSTYPSYNGSGPCKPKPSCGINPTLTQLTIDHRSPQWKDAKHADWPWYVMLIQNGKHVCDGALVDHTWAITSSVCLNKYPKAYWTVKPGSARLASVSPYDQERRVMGIVKSPFGPDGVTLINLHKSVNITVYTSPVCLPDTNTDVLPGDYCFTLGWDFKGNQLQQTIVKVLNPESCKFSSSPSSLEQRPEYYNTKIICTEVVGDSLSRIYSTMRGQPLFCQKNSKWFIVGTESREAVCRGNNTARMYYKTSIQARWIRHTIEYLKTT
ncbi:prostasin-like isoform X2 [Tachypleus tridentatus]